MSKLPKRLKNEINLYDKTHLNDYNQNKTHDGDLIANVDFKFSMHNRTAYKWSY